MLVSTFKWNPTRMPFALERTNAMHIAAERARTHTHTLTHIFIYILGLRARMFTTSIMSLDAPTPTQWWNSARAFALRDDKVSFIELYERAHGRPPWKRARSRSPPPRRAPEQSPPRNWRAPVNCKSGTLRLEIGRTREQREVRS